MTENIIQLNHKEIKLGRKELKQIHIPTFKIVDFHLKPLFDKLNLSKIFKITAWIKKSVCICQNSNKRTRVVGPNKLKGVNVFWIKKQHGIRQSKIQNK